MDLRWLVQQTFEGLLRLEVFDLADFDKQFDNIWSFRIYKFYMVNVLDLRSSILRISGNDSYLLYGFRIAELNG